MNFTELKKWAKSYGYDILKTKGKEECLWSKIDEPEATGIGDSYSDTATQIYNHITNNRWVEYQEEYKKEKQKEIKFQ